MPFIVFLLATLLTFPACAAFLEVPSDFPTIQTAIEEATPGDIIDIEEGTYSERVVIRKSDLRLQADGVILDGTALGGTGIGLLVSGTDDDPLRDVVVTGISVQNFERGLVLRAVTRSRISGATIRANLDRDSDEGINRSGQGLVLINARFNEVSRNIVQDNGHDGIVLGPSSSFNFIQDNDSSNNGQQDAERDSGGIRLVGRDNDGNLLLGNEVHGNTWGILIGPQASANGNFILNNEVQDNRRAGLAVLGDAQGNILISNIASANGTSDVAPSSSLDFFDDGRTDNVWIDNDGSSNF